MEFLWFYHQKGYWGSSCVKFESYHKERTSSVNGKLSILSVLIICTRSTYFSIFYLTPHISRNNYRPRSRGDNTFGSVRCASVVRRVYKAIAVDHAFNYFEQMTLITYYHRTSCTKFWPYCCLSARWALLPMLDWLVKKDFHLILVPLQAWLSQHLEQTYIWEMERSVCSKTYVVVGIMHLHWIPIAASVIVGVYVTVLYPSLLHLPWGIHAVALVLLLSSPQMWPN